MSYLKADKKRKKSSTGRSGAKKSRRSILPVILAVIVCLIVAGAVAGFVRSPSRGQCRDIVEDFQTACNNMNVNGILDCLNPKIANPLKAVVLIGGAVTSTDTNEVLGNILGELGGGVDTITQGSGLDITEAFRTMELKVTGCGFPAKTRKVRCRATFGIFTQYLDIYVTKRNGEPYISKVAFAKE